MLVESRWGVLLGVLVRLGKAACRYGILSVESLWPQCVAFDNLFVPRPSAITISSCCCCSKLGGFA